MPVFSINLVALEGSFFWGGGRLFRKDGAPYSGTVEENRCRLLFRLCEVRFVNDNPL